MIRSREVEREPQATVDAGPDSARDSPRALDEQVLVDGHHLADDAVDKFDVGPGSRRAGELDYHALVISIRRATREDVPTILSLIRELATYEREPDAVVATEEGLLADGFGEHPAFHVLLAELDGEVAGFAFYFFSYSTWLGRRCLYLEDLFVAEKRRRRGAGLALMRALAREARDTGCTRFVWQVLDWNAPSIAFYEKLGARVAREWLTVRLEDDAIDALASSGS